MAELTVLVAARDEEERIGETVRALARAFPAAEVVVADDGSRDGTARVAEEAGARVVRLPRRGKGQALTLAERELDAGPLLLCDADLEGELEPLVQDGADLAVARFAQREGGGFGVAKASRSRAYPPAQRVRCRGASLGAAFPFARGAGGVLPARGGVRLRDADDDRCRARGLVRARGVASPQAPRDRP